MKGTTLGLVIALAVGAAALLVPWPREAAHSALFIDAQDEASVKRGREVYVAHCAACHGAQGEGQPDWRQRLPNGRLPAPPHDDSGHTWHHPDAVLFDIVKHGLVPGRTAPEGYESDMPAYASILPDEDIVAVLAYIKSIWSAEARARQEEVTRAYRN